MSYDKVSNIASKTKKWIDAEDNHAVQEARLGIIDTAYSNIQKNFENFKKRKENEQY